MCIVSQLCFCKSLAFLYSDYINQLIQRCLSPKSVGVGYMNPRVEGILILRGNTSVQRLKEASAETTTTPPKVQKIVRLKTLEKEHKDALERAVSLNIPHAVGVDEEEPSTQKEEEPMEDIPFEECKEYGEDASTSKTQGRDARTNWNEVVEKLFKRDITGKLRLMRETTDPE